MSTGVDIFRQSVDPRKWQGVNKALQNAGDDQSIKLLSDIMHHFIGKFDMKSGEEQAWNRLIGLVLKGASWDPSLIRNNVFKVANSLGMRLPSGMFASDKAALVESWGPTLKQAGSVTIHGKLNYMASLDMRVIDGGWYEPDYAPEMYDANVVFSAKVEVRYGMGLWSTLYEVKNIRGRVFSDPGGGFYLQPKGGKFSQDKATSALVSTILGEAVADNHSKLTKRGSIRVGASMARHIKALQKLFPKSMIKDSREFDGRSGGIWTGFGEDGTSNYYRAGYPN